MSFTKLLLIWPGSPILSMLIWIVVMVVLLYRVIHNGFRLMSRSVMLAEQKLAQRNKEVSLSAGIESVERLIEREFYRVDAVVKRDLSGYPTLHRALSDQTTKIDEDYRESSETPPPPPGWVGAVEAVANLPNQGDGTVANILTEIHKTTVSQYKTTLEEHRKNVAVRHNLLKKMMPYWRSGQDHNWITRACQGDRQPDD